MNDRPSTDFTVWFGGSASGSPGRGGYAAVVIDGRSGLVSAEVSGSAAETTVVDMLVAGGDGEHVLGHHDAKCPASAFWRRFIHVDRGMADARPGMLVAFSDVGPS